MSFGTPASSNAPAALPYASASAPRLEHSPGRLLLVAEPRISRGHLIIKAVTAAMVVGLNLFLVVTMVRLWLEMALRAGGIPPGTGMVTLIVAEMTLGFLLWGG